ncbi:MAG: cytosine deaminase [Halobacteriaceae archaeon]
MTEHLVKNASTLDGGEVDIEIRSGIIDAIVPAGQGDESDFSNDRIFDANDRLVTPPLIEPHLHLDATLTAGTPRWNQTGTLDEGIDIWGKYKKDLKYEDVQERATRCIEWLVANGVTRVRTHADTTEEDLTAVRALCDLRSDVDHLIDLQVVGFPQDGIVTDQGNEDLLRDAIDIGIDIIGGIPHNEDTREDGVQDVKIACELAGAHDMPLDLHIDETDDPGSRFTEVLASEARKRSLSGVTASHATAMHSYPNQYAAKVIDLLKSAGVNVITNPPDNSVLQGRFDDYPRRRGHTRVDQLREAGVTVGIGHDSVMDPWYHYGIGDPLDAAFILIHYGHFSGRNDVHSIWEMLTTANAEIFGAGNYGLKEGNDGSLAIHQASDAFNALRRRPPRRLVLRDGEPIARTKPGDTTIHTRQGSRTVNFSRD